MSKQIKYQITAEDKTKKGTDLAKSRIRAMSTQSSADLGKTQGSVMNLASSIKNGLALGAVAVATKALIEFGKASLESFSENERIFVRLQTAVDRLGVSYDEIISFSNELARSSLATGTEIADLTTRYLQLGTSQEDVQRLMEATVAYSNATGESLESVSKNLFKTLSGQRGEIAELVPEIREMTAAQLESGEALDVVIANLGVYNDVVEETYSQKMKNLTDSFDSFKTSIGSMLSSAIMPLIEGVTWLLDRLTEVINNFNDEESPEDRLASFTSMRERYIEELRALQEQEANALSSWEEMVAEVGEEEAAIAFGPSSKVAYDSADTNSVEVQRRQAIEAEIAAVDAEIARLRAEIASNTVETEVPDFGPTWAGSDEVFADFAARMQELFTTRQEQEELFGSLFAQGIEDEGEIFDAFLREGLPRELIKISTEDFQRLLANIDGDGWSDTAEEIYDYFIQANFLTEEQLRLLEEQRQLLQQEETMLYSGSTGAAMGNFEQGIEPVVSDTTEETAGIFDMLGSKVLSIVGQFTELGIIIDPIGTIIQTLVSGIMQVIGPLISEGLQPLFGFITIVGQMLGQMLVPAIKLVSIVLEPLAKAFLWFYNAVMRPIGNVLIRIATAISNGVIGAINAVIRLINKIPGVNIGTLSKINVDSLLLEKISFDDMNAAGGSSNPYSTGEMTGSSASYSGGKNLTNNITINTDVITGETGGLRALAMLLKTEIERAEALGY
jgi:hypothetical protein